jgi:hypothetical protein
MTDEPELPIPEVEPRPLGEEQYFALTPEKLELCRGYLIDPPDRHEGRTKLLAALLVNEGLARAVQLAPPERWREALQQVYGTGG